MNVRWFRKDEEKILRNSIESIWAHNHIFVRDSNLLNYMFYNNPMCSKIAGNENFTFLGLWDDNKIVGILGVLPYKLNVKGEERFGVALTNWKVNSEYSGSGLMLLKYVYGCNPDLILSLGINQNVAKLYEIMRWNVIEDVPRWIGINDVAKVEEVLLKDANNSVIRNFENLKEVAVNSQLIVLDSVDEKWDEFYWGKFAKSTIGFVRDYKFLKWRYIDHPNFTYQFITTKNSNNQYTGLIVLRLEKILEEKHTIGRILEFIAMDEETANVLANSITVFQKDVLFWDFYCMSGISSWGLENVGFKRKPKWLSDKIVVPTRFQPLDLECINMMATVYVSEKVKNKLNLLDDMQCYITKGDSDQDRPN